MKNTGFSLKSPNPIIQAKLTINSLGDKYEQEADAMANKVMRMPSKEGKEIASSSSIIGASIQRKCSACEEEEKQKPIMRKESGNMAGMQVSNSFSRNLNTTKGDGLNLPKSTKSFMENAFSADFSQVRIHADSQANNLSQSINAKAFTHGNDIYFGAGQYNPNSYSGKSLLAHELTHTVQQNGKIQRVPMPDETTITDLENYTENSKQNIIYDNGFNFQTGLSKFFQKGIVRDVRTGYNVTYSVNGFDPAESWVEPAMRALALYNFKLNAGETVTPITNTTTVQLLDMTGQSNPKDATILGPNARIRFTATKFDKTGKGKDVTENVQILIEKLGNFTATTSAEKPADRKTRYETTYQITNAVPVRNDPLGDPPETMSDARFDLVLVALDRVPTTILSQATGIPIHMGLSARGPEGEIAEYSQTKAPNTTVWNRRITAYGDFFRASVDIQAFVMAHEFGHALDFRPNEGASGKGGPVLSQGAAKDSFGEALKKDGGVVKGVSTYDKTKKTEKEYFAEAFTMYINEKSTLKALRPNVYAYFLAKYP
jgi:Domain of unknown function (DUF4157)